MKAFKVLCVLVTMVWASAAQSASADAVVQQVFDKLVEQAPPFAGAQVVVDTTMRYQTIAYSDDDFACRIHLYKAFADRNSEDSIAVVLAHELAHCLLDHQRQRAQVTSVERRHLSWQFEYDADALGMKLAKSAGYDALTAFKGLLAHFPGGAEHPTGQARWKALQGDPREYPTTVNRGAIQVASSISVQNGKIMLGGALPR